MISALIIAKSAFFSFNDTATTEIYTLSLHDALPISKHPPDHLRLWKEGADHQIIRNNSNAPDRKSTRLNSSHGYISYAVFCLKKKNTQIDTLYKRVNGSLTGLDDKLKTP